MAAASKIRFWPEAENRLDRAIHHTTPPETAACTADFSDIALKVDTFRFLLMHAHQIVSYDIGTEVDIYLVNMEVSIALLTL